MISTRAGPSGHRHGKHSKERSMKSPCTPCQMHTHTLEHTQAHFQFCRSQARGLRDRGGGGGWWWMCCIYFFQTAGPQSGQRDSKGHRSTHTLAPILTCVCECTCVCVLKKKLWYIHCRHCTCCGDLNLSYYGDSSSSLGVFITSIIIFYCDNMLYDWGKFRFKLEKGLRLEQG